MHTFIHLKEEKTEISGKSRNILLSAFVWRKRWILISKHAPENMASPNVQLDRSSDRILNAISA
jgi:hypothetical protein